MIFQDLTPEFLLEKYEENRNKYITMSDFIPEIKDYFNTYAEALN